MSQTKLSVSEEWARARAESGARSRAAAAASQGVDPREALTPDWKRVFKAQTTAENTLRAVNRNPAATQTASDAAFASLGKRRAVRGALDAVVAEYPAPASTPQVIDARKPRAGVAPRTGGRWQLPAALAATAGLAGAGAYALSQQKSAAYAAGVEAVRAVFR